MRLPVALIRLCALGLAPLAATPCWGQPAPAPSGAAPPAAPAAPAAPEGQQVQGDTGPSTGQDEGPGDLDTTVGYIDSAIPRSQFRIGYEDGQDSNRPTRAEFFYAKGPQPSGPGPMPEVSLNYQQIDTHLEYAVFPWLSAFLEAPTRFIRFGDSRPGGFGDLQLGFKYGLEKDETGLTTFQLRTYIPTGNVHEGLGTGHVSLEPALLINRRLLPWLTLEGELRLWAPVGGTDFAGDVIRYGIGVSLGRQSHTGWWLEPVTELVGWTVLRGKELEAFSDQSFIIKDAAGDTIINFKQGVRLGYQDRGDLYVGFGRALTGEFWYKDMLRVEMRFFF
jgi:hypothetical protein